MQTLHALPVSETRAPTGDLLRVQSLHGTAEGHRDLPVRDRGAPVLDGGAAVADSLPVQRLHVTPFTDSSPPFRYARTRHALVDPVQRLR